MASRVVYARGAEAVLYRIDYMGLPAILKIRVSKTYRHPVYDRLFRYRRTVVEGRVLSHLYLLGLRVPALYFIDPDNYYLVMEYIEGLRLSDHLDRLPVNTIESIAYDLGRQAGIMHSNTVYHGDFTVANVIVKDDKPYIIDFGLSGYSRDLEEYAIDIHLLMRSIEALYPSHVKLFMESFWSGYKSVVGEAKCRETMDRVRDVRLRGRYIEERLRRKIKRERYM